jgi:predicted Zn-dependent protease with MMP-like domain
VDYETLSETDWSGIERVWELLEDGAIEEARLELGARFRARLSHPDVRIVDAALALEEGEAERALTVLKGAERSADPALFFHLRATASFDLCRFEPARDDAERALAVREDFPDAHDLLSRAYEFLGDADRSADHAEQANALDPERYPLPLEIEDAEFDALVERALKELPEPVRKQLDELPVIVEPLPDPAFLSADSPPLSPDLLGLFVGRDLMSRTHQDLPAAPGAIYLFRRNLQRFCATTLDLEREVRITVQHEVGHLLGLDEDDLEQWGLA